MVQRKKNALATVACTLPYEGKFLRFLEESTSLPLFRGEEQQLTATAVPSQAVYAASK